MLQSSRARQLGHCLAAIRVRAPRGRGQASWRRLLQRSRARQQGRRGLAVTQARAPRRAPRRRRAPGPTWLPEQARALRRRCPLRAQARCLLGALRRGGKQWGMNNEWCRRF